MKTIQRELLLCPSMMCCDFGNLAGEVNELERAGCDIFHCDIMDGCFVPNMTMGINDVKAVCHNTTKLVDVHLMIENPREKIDWFIDAGARLIYFHPESERYSVSTLTRIKERGVASGIAINPDTSVPTILELLNLCDYVMVMTVTPGFAGQKLIPFTKNKIMELATLKSIYGYKLIIDGACSPEVIRDMFLQGVDGFVLGTSALFSKGRAYNSLISELRDSVRF